MAASVSGGVAASPLSDVASSMQPGEFTEFSTNGFGMSLLDAGSSRSIVEYAAKAVWDPVRRELDFIGEGHYAGRKHIRYRESTNGWSVQAQPPYIGHAYEHNAINYATGDVYIRPIRSRSFRKYNKSTGQWGSIPSLPDNVFVTAAGGVEYFPELGGLVFTDASAGVWLFDESTDRWSRLSQPLSIGSNHNFASYNPVHKIVLFGSGNGSTNVFKLDANGNITQVADTPGGRILGPGLRGRITPDTVSGDYLAFFSDGDFFKYEVANDRWTNLGRHPVAGLARDWFSATPISTYGVVLFKIWNYASSTVYLYKHANSGGPSDTDAPTVPTRLSASAVSDSEVSLSWDAASDNVAALGYRIFRNGSEIATVVETDFRDRSVDGGTSYSYTVQAYDFAGNESGHSSSASATTPGTPSNPNPDPQPIPGGGGSSGDEAAAATAINVLVLLLLTPIAVIARRRRHSASA